MLRYVINETLILRNKKIPDLLNLPEMTDERQRNIMSIILALFPPAYLSSTNLFVILVIIAAKIILKHGLITGASYVFSALMIVECGALLNINKGIKLADLGMALVGRMQDEWRIKTTFVALAFAKHWIQPVDSILGPLLENFDQGVELGENQFGAYNLYAYTYISLCAGKYLPDLLAKGKKFRMQALGLQQESTANYIGTYTQAIHNFIEPSDFASLEGEFFSESVKIPDFLNKNDKTGLMNVYFCKMMLCYYMGDYDGALLAYKNGLPLIGSLISSYVVPTFHFYGVLIHTKLLEQQERQEKRKFWGIINKYIKNIKLWAKFCPESHLHRLYICQAEVKRLKNKDYEAIADYEMAIKHAEDNGFFHEAGLACELMAQVYAKSNRQKISHLFVSNAANFYRLWGADAKVKQLQFLYPHLTMDTQEERLLKGSNNQYTSSYYHNVGELSKDLDISAIQKIMRILSETIDHNKLIGRLLRIVSKLAGAQRIVLALMKHKKLYIHGEWNEKENKINLFDEVLVDSSNTPVSILKYVVRASKFLLLEKSSIGKFAKDPYIIAHQPLSILTIPLVYKGELCGVIYFENMIMENAFPPDRIETLNLLISQVTAYIKNAMLYDDTIKLSNSYARFVPAEFLKLLQKKNIMEIKVGDSIQREMTVLFSDIRNYSSMCESLTPTETFTFLNNYLSGISPIIRKHNGFIDKYIGDAIMAIFPNSPDDAVLCSIEMQAFSKTFNSTSNFPPIEIGVGINIGMLMMGTVGEKNRMDGTVISDAVNVAQRIESLTKEIDDAGILISDNTYNKLKDKTSRTAEWAGSFNLKGRKSHIGLYKILY